MGSRTYRWALVALLLAAWMLRLPPALDQPLHPDEALYGYWGLLVGRDPLLATVPVDKPPLLLYLLAGMQALWGGGHELAIRWLGLSGGLSMVALVASLGEVLYRHSGTALVAAAGVALSSLAIAFSAAAFPDSLMAALGLAACLMAARGRGGWAGLLAGLSFATKQTGLVWLPLVLLLQTARSDPESLNLKWGTLDRLLVAFFLVVGLMISWDAVRVARGGSSFWRMGNVSYGGLRLAWPQALWNRLHGWMGLTRHLFASPIVGAAMLLVLPALLWNALMRHHRAYAGFADVLLISFSLIYFLFHWLVAFPIWSRYLLPLAPILSLLLGRFFGHVLYLVQRLPGAWYAARRALLIACCLLFAACLILLAFNAARGRYLVGGDRAAYGGVREIAAFLSGLPEGSVVYHHWLGRHYRYYLFDAPVYLAYWPTPAWLAQDVHAFGGREARYLTIPSWEASARVERALEEVGYGLEAALTTGGSNGLPSLTLYRIEAIDSTDR